VQQRAKLLFQLVPSLEQAAQLRVEARLGREEKVVYLCAERRARAPAQQRDR